MAAIFILQLTFLSASQLRKRSHGKSDEAKSSCHHAASGNNCEVGSTPGLRVFMQFPVSTGVEVEWCRRSLLSAVCGSTLRSTLLCYCCRSLQNSFLTSLPLFLPMYVHPVLVMQGTPHIGVSKNPAAVRQTQIVGVCLSGHHSRTPNF